MLIYDILKMDHRMAIGIIDAIEPVGDGSRRKDILKFLRLELAMHARAEEEAFYEVLRRRVAVKMQLDIAEDEHRQLEKLLSQLSNGTGEGEGWLSALRDLRAVLQRHIEKEEADIFHIAEGVFTSDEASDMAARFVEAKGRLGMENPVGAAGHAVRHLFG